MTMVTNADKHLVFSILISIMLTYISISSVVIVLITVPLLLKPSNWTDLWLLIPIWLLNSISICMVLFKNHVASLINKIPMSNFITFYILLCSTIFIDWRFFTMFFDMPYYKIFAPQYIDNTINTIYTVIPFSAVLFLLIRYFNIKGEILPYQEGSPLIGEVEFFFAFLLLSTFLLLSGLLIVYDILVLDYGDPLLT